MKKVYILFSLLILAGFVFGQTVVSLKDNAAKNSKKSIVGTQSFNQTKAVIWSEDFETWPLTNLTVSSGAASTVVDPTTKWHDGGGFAEILYVDALMEDEWMKSGSIALPTGSIILQFDWFGSYYWHVDPYDGADVTVNISTDGGTTWTPVWVDDDQTMVENAGGVWPWTSFTTYTAAIDISAYAGTSIMVGFHYLGNDGAQWEFDNASIYDIVPLDLELTSINTSPFSVPGSVSIPGTITNLGGDDITSFDVNYTIDGGAPSATFSVTGLTIPFGGTYDFTHNVPYNFATDGTYTIGVAISNVNGGGEVELTNNVLTKNISVTSDFIQRLVVWEEFSTEECPNCPPVMDEILAYEGTQPNMVMMTHHSGYYTDFLTITESEDPGMMEFYNDGGGSYAPAGMSDRFYNGLDNDEDGTNEPGPVFWPGNSYAEDIIDAKVNEPSFVSVQVDGIYNATSNVLDLTVSGSFVADFTGNYGVSVWVCENNIQESTSGQSGATYTPYIHQHSVRDVISSVWGDAITTPTTSGSNYSKTYSYTIPGTWVEDEVYVVAFVNKINTTDVNARDIQNAGTTTLMSLVGNEEVVNQSDIQMYPNPTNGIVNFMNVENADINIYNMLGELVFSINSKNSFKRVDLSNLENGTYIVKVTENDNVVTKRIVINK